MKDSVRIELSKSAYAHNLRFIKKLLGPEVLFSSVVKGNAYGHGIEHLVPMACELGVRHFSVFNGEEAFRVHRALTQNATIMVMGMLTVEQMEWAIANDIEFFVFEKKRLVKALDIAKKQRRKAKIHVEIETGMHRTGIDRGDWKEVLSTLKENAEHLVFKGLCTHFAGAESIANYYRVNKQRKVFQRAKQKLENDQFTPELYHTACSAASMRYPKTQMDMCRIGIIQYGFFPSKEVLVDYLTKNKETVEPLKRIISWKSRVMSTKEVKKGGFIGYGTSYFANERMRIATVPVGYGHGFSRGLSNQGRVLVRGQIAPVVGVVNMNMCSVDVTHIEGVETGDEVVLIGYQGEHEISVSSFSDYSSQVNYELLTRLPGETQRIIVD